MIRRLYLPDQVKSAIRTHIDTAVGRVLHRYASAHEKEDALTGALCSKLEIGPQEVFVDQDEIRGTWKWEIDYKTFRGGGKASPESLIGADGMFELHLMRNGININSKSLLFQAKIGWKGRKSDLLEQCVKLLVWRGATTIVNYTEEVLETYEIEDVLSGGGAKPTSMLPLQDLLGEKFLNCEIGDSDLSYNAVSKKLIWLDHNDEYVATKFNLRTRLKFKITQPPWGSKGEVKIDKEIPNDEIYQHVLKTNFKDAYDPERAKTLAELTRIKRKFSHLMHPDKRATLPAAQQNVFTILMQEFNAKAARQEEKIRRSKPKRDTAKQRRQF